MARSSRCRKRGASAEARGSEGFFVASCGFQRATASMSPESATTSEYSRRDSRFEAITKNNTGKSGPPPPRRGLGFPTWSPYLFGGATTLNAVVNRGALGVAWSLACTVAGALLWITVRGFEYTPLTTHLVP